MKNLVILSTVLMLLVGLSFAQDITPIAEIQDTTGTGSDESAMIGETVTIQGIVSAESYAFGGSYYFVQDAEAKWSGIKVYDYERGAAYGDSVQITATVAEYDGVTELTDVTDYTIIDSTRHEVKPIEVATGDIGTGAAEAEAYEGVLLKVGQSEITNPDAGYGQWLIDDGSGEVMIDDAAEFYFNAANYDSVLSLVGVLEYSYGDHKLLPRLAYDIESGGKYTRIQRIQQVRHSDLLKAPKDGESDVSYMVDDTMTVKAVVTMPTGLSYAGAGIKFIMEEPEGGPWSAILSYHEDSTAYPTLYEGDLVELTGYIGEYNTGSSNMTEFWITSPIQVLGWGQELPPVDTVNTGDLRLPVTAEQWGNVMVAVKDAKVTATSLQYDLFTVDDGTGGVNIGSDSDSISAETVPDPPFGTTFKYIKGWIYHHYGSYDDSTTYKLVPLYKEDLVKSAGPPQMTNASRSPGIPKPGEKVDISVDVSSTIEIDTVFASIEIYDIAGWNGETDPDLITKDTVGLTLSEGITYTGQIPEYSADHGILYHMVAVNDTGRATMPTDIESAKYGYYLLEDGLTIPNLQISPYGPSLYDGYDVEVSGVVTVDTTFNNNYEAYVIQDEAAPWNGISVFGVGELLSRGDEIKVYGQLTENNPDWSYKWEHNTVILADSIELLSEDNTLPSPIEVNTNELSNDSESAEMYESVLVKSNDVEVTSLNDYDWSLDDGSGSCLLDDDAATSDLYNWFWGDDTLNAGDSLNFAQGPFIFSFGTFKITPRDLNDVDKLTAVENHNDNIANSYKLKQNYPNPFNPTTHVAFQIPEPKRVNISIYNILGQKVRTLTSRKFATGSHILIWNGKNDNGATVPSGAYFMRMEAGNFTQVKKMLFLK